MILYTICTIIYFCPLLDVIINLKLVLMLYLISLLRFSSKAMFTTAIRQANQNRLHRIDEVMRDFSFICFSVGPAPNNDILSALNR
jgi:hypothetical protein